MFGLLRVAAGINILALVGVCVFLLWNGSPAISWEFLTEPPRRMMTAGGVWPCIVGTFLLAFGAMLIAFPLGVASAVYLHEYGGKGRYTRYLRLGISNLAGVPSVVFGLFGLAFFVTFLGMGVSLLAGVLTLAVLTLPVIINTTEEALRQVPDAWREDAALKAKDYATVVTKYGEYLKQNNYQDTARIFNCGYAANQAKNYAEAAKYFDMAVKMNYNVDDSYVGEAMAYRNLNKTEEFLTTVKEGLKVIPDGNKNKTNLE